MKCPKCGNENTQKKGMRAGKQRYRCRSCGACFTEGVEYVEQVKMEPLQMTCPSCNSSHIRRDGKDGGYQRYECHDCGLNFSDYTIAKKYRCSRFGKNLRHSLSLTATGRYVSPTFK